MTVIEFSRRDLKINFLALTLVLILILVSAWMILVYNKSVDLKHDILLAREKLEDYQVKNAELKNNLFQILDNLDEESILASSGLVLDKSPQYFKRNHQLISELRSN
ncbi:MAG: hypothetical protein KatS3mg098_447 [Candidatus Parcubacteria bacterium]|nr:MAG: hypothetical protein KatS3mg098_447 [Candidatus Parcubacteria bacterium]